MELIKRTLFLFLVFSLFSGDFAFTQEEKIKVFDKAKIEKPELPSRIFRLKGNIFFITSKTRIKLEARGEDVKSILYSINNSEYKKYSSPLKFDMEGLFFITYQSIDSLGNIEKENYMTIIVDNTPPNLFVEIPKINVIYKNKVYYVPYKSQINLLAEDNLSGVSYIEYSIDGKNFIVYKSPIVLDKEGKFKIFYKGYDNVGNSTRIYEVSFYVDNTPPVINIKTPYYKRVGKSIYITSKQPIVLEAKDSGSGVRKLFFKIDNKPYSEYLSPVFLSSGRHILKVKAEDNAGNVSLEKVFNFVVDDNPPRTNVNFEE